MNPRFVPLGIHGGAQAPFTAALRLFAVLLLSITVGLGQAWAAAVRLDVDNDRSSAVVVEVDRARVGLRVRTGCHRHVDRADDTRARRSRGGVARLGLADRQSSDFFEASHRHHDVSAAQAPQSSLQLLDALRSVAVVHGT